MAYYVKVGNEFKVVPKCCSDCYLCQEKYAVCKSCSLLEEYNEDSCWEIVPTATYYCTASCNKSINDISKKPDWCPIVSGDLSVKYKFYTERGEH